MKFGRMRLISWLRIVCLPILYKNVNTRYDVWSYNYSCYLFGCQAWLSHESKNVHRGCSRTWYRWEYLDQPGECNKKLGKIARWVSKRVLRWQNQWDWNWQSMWYAWATREGSAYGALVRKAGGSTLEYLFLFGRIFKQVGRDGTGFILVRMGTNGGLLWKPLSSNSIRCFKFLERLRICYSVKKDFGPLC